MTAKLIRRHPHVFDESEARELLAGTDPETAREVLANWDQIKREVEGRGADDPFADVPENLPGLLYARKLLRRADAETRARRVAGRRRRASGPSAGSATSCWSSCGSRGAWASTPSSRCERGGARESRRCQNRSRPLRPCARGV